MERAVGEQEHHLRDDLHRVDWGADFIDAGESGRIDADSGHGPWPDGLLKLGGFLKKLG